MPSDFNLKCSLITFLFVAAVFCDTERVLAVQQAPSNFETIINAPPESIEDGTVIASDTQLNLATGGTVGSQVQIGDRLGGSTNVELNVSGGTIGRFLRINNNAIFNVSGGTIEGNGAAESGSTVNISGGTFNGFEFEPGSSAVVSGGNITGFFTAGSDDIAITGGTFGNFTSETNSAVNISGGRFNNLLVREGGVTNISGGNFLSNVQIASETTVNISGGSFPDGFTADPNTSRPSANIFGGEFLLNGESVPNPESVRLTSGQLLTGTLADGSVAFLSSGSSQALIRLQESPLPAINTNTFVVNAPDDQTPNGLRRDMSLVLGGSGVLTSDYGVSEAQLTVNGGLVERGLGLFRSRLEVNGGVIEGQLDATFESQLDVSGGTIEGTTSLDGNSTLNLTGGTLGSVVLRNSIANMTEGEIQSSLVVLTGSAANISGGTIGERFGVRALEVRDDAVARISGGSILNEINVQTGGLLEVSGGNIQSILARADSDINVSVLEAFIDDSPITEFLTLDTPIEINARNVNLTGLLSDGSEFRWGLSDTDTSFPPIGTFPGFFDSDARLTLTLVSIPEPTAMPLVFAIGGFRLMRRFRKHIR